jgi:hypothetical protein
MNQGPRWILLMKKTRAVKSRATFKLVISTFHHVNFRTLCSVVPYKSSQTESSTLRTLKFCQYQHETHIDKQKKPQGAVALRNYASLIFKLVNFCSSTSETRTLVQYLTKPLRQKVLVLGLFSINTRHIQTIRKKNEGRCDFQG